MKPEFQVLDQDIATDSRDGIEYICITDIAKYKHPDRTDDLNRNWLRDRNAIEFLGIWEQINNPDFKGNMRDHANVQQLVCLANHGIYECPFYRAGHESIRAFDKAQ